MKTTVIKDIAQLTVGCLSGPIGANATELVDLTGLGREEDSVLNPSQCMAARNVLGRKWKKLVRARGCLHVQV